MVQRHRSIERLMELLGRLPGVGPKTAERFAYHLLRIGRDDALAVADAIVAVRDAV
ncbi:MAG: recombination protein RecR, partial [Planctomycetota bacterium]